MSSFGALVGEPARVSACSMAADVVTLHVMDSHTKRIRGIGEQTVKDESVAERLKAWISTVARARVSMATISRVSNSPAPAARPPRRDYASWVTRVGPWITNGFEGISTLHGVADFRVICGPDHSRLARPRNRPSLSTKLPKYVASILSETARMAGQDQYLCRSFTFESTSEAEEELSMQILSRVGFLSGLWPVVPSCLDKERQIDWIFGM